MDDFLMYATYAPRFLLEVMAPTMADLVDRLPVVIHPGPGISHSSSSFGLMDWFVFLVLCGLLSKRSSPPSTTQPQTDHGPEIP